MAAHGENMAGQTIRELAEVDPALLEEFLAEQDIDRQVTRWKYFDDAFNNGRNRGFAAFQNGRLVGFIGLTPFQARAGSTIFDTAWTCDWYVDTARANSTTGSTLLKRATGAYQILPITCQDGIAPKFKSALTEQQYESPFHATYDAADVEWQIGSCPRLRSFTCFTSSSAAVLIRQAGNRGPEWRMALACKQREFSELFSLIKYGVKCAYESGGNLINIQVSRHDKSLRAALSRCGFKEILHLPFCAFHQDPGELRNDCMSSLSYLDVDMANVYR